MTDVSLKTGWERLSNGFDVEFHSGIPVRLADNGRESTLSEADLLEEVAALGGLSVQLGEWEPGERPDEREAPLVVSGEQLTEVLHRLALASAAVFVERYQKPIDKDDVDWDTLEYATDFRYALEHCGLTAGDADQDACRFAYLETMHQETWRLAGAAETPPVMHE